LVAVAAQPATLTVNDMNEDTTTRTTVLMDWEVVDGYLIEELYDTSTNRQSWRLSALAEHTRSA
jgi:hypothetical protein